MKLTLTIVFLMISTLLVGQSFSEKITKEFTFEKKGASNTLIVANINGDILVTGYNGDKILVEVTKVINAKTDARLEKGKKVQLGVVDRADSVILYVDGLCQGFGKRSEHKRFQAEGWGYNWDNKCSNCNEEFDYKMDFTIKVPFSIHVDVSTVNNGNIVVENTKGIVNANNVNGSIRLQQLEREAKASTINGDVDIEYASNPKSDCRFYSLNGDINAWFQKGLTARLSFESFNGSFYTNIDKIQQLPAKLEQNSSGNGMKYKVNGNMYQVGSGGMLLDFETFNGNVYLKEKTN
jgi:DUF4097 and DUF4098 domain-containing protein YvlB